MLTVDIQPELKSQRLSRLAAHQHTVHKDLKIVHHGAELGVNAEPKLHFLPVVTEDQLGIRNGIIHAVVNIEGDTVTYTFTVPEGATADITLNGKTEHVGSGEYTYTKAI